MKNLLNQVVLDIQQKIGHFLTLRPIVSRARKHIPQTDVRNLQINSQLLVELEQCEKRLFDLIPKAMSVQKGEIKHIPNVLMDAIGLNNTMNKLTERTITHLRSVKNMYGGDFEVPKSTILDFANVLPYIFIPLLFLLFSKK